MNKKSIILIVLVCLVLYVGVQVKNKQKQEELEYEQEIQKNERREKFKNTVLSFGESALIQANLDMMNLDEKEIDRCYVFSKDSNVKGYTLNSFSNYDYEGSAHVVCEGICYYEVWLKNDEFYVDQFPGKSLIGDTEVKELANNSSFKSINCPNASSYDELSKK